MFRPYSQFFSLHLFPFLSLSMSMFLPFSLDMSLPYSQFFSLHLFPFVYYLWPCPWRFPWTCSGLIPSSFSCTCFYPCQVSFLPSRCSSPYPRPCSCIPVLVHVLFHTYVIVPALVSVLVPRYSPLSCSLYVIFLVLGRFISLSTTSTN
jgi:hypothetical protein